LIENSQGNGMVKQQKYHKPKIDTAIWLGGALNAPFSLLTQTIF